MKILSDQTQVKSATGLSKNGGVYFSGDGYLTQRISLMQIAVTMRYRNKMIPGG
jgi:hypothetical protein